MKIGCNLLNAQESSISLIPQVHAGEKKRGGNYRTPNIELETWAKFSHFLRSFTETIWTSDSAEYEEERVVRGVWKHRRFLKVFSFLLFLIELL